MRLTCNSLYVFLFVFVYVYMIGAVNRDHRPTIGGLVWRALILAASVILIGIFLGEARKPRVVRRGLYAFAILSLYFFLCLWQVSGYHPIPYPELWAFVIATIATVVESFRSDPVRSSDSQKISAGEKGSGALRVKQDSRDAV
jgi:hypothetical protein